MRQLYYLSRTHWRSNFSNQSRQNIHSRTPQISQGSLVRGRLKNHVNFFVYESRGRSYIDFLFYSRSPGSHVAGEVRLYLLGSTT